ncbi:MAG: FtsX-like permease family protein [Lachnospiraceae bacterium]|nr:FtsX-like permease family protein [Lachnospiraceae bacterium]
MNNQMFFYPKLAVSNIRKNGKIYFPYLLTCIITAAMYFMICSLADNPGIDQVIGGRSVRSALFMASGVVGFFAVIFLFYTNSFLMKQRRRELALYNILGMEKRHLARMLFWETVDVGMLTLLFGLGAGLLFNKLLFLIILHMFGGTVPIAFAFSGKAFRNTCILFLVIFLLILLNSIRKIQFKSPMELLQESKAGEREPKTHFLTALLGVLCLGIGYYMAVSIKNPVAALALFFVAVLFVIVGTYCMFSAGSIAFLKFLRSRKGYYYKANHFVSVSGMLYRMRQNAVGLANICVLSTMVLVMVSSSLSLYIGLDDMARTQNFREVQLASKEDSKEAGAQLKELVGEILKEEGYTPFEEAAYVLLGFSVLERGNSLEIGGEDASILEMNALRTLYVMTAEDYGVLTGEKPALSAGEIYLGGAPGKSFRDEALSVLGREYRIAGRIKELPDGVVRTAGSGAYSYLLVVEGKEELEELNRLQREAYGEHASSPEFIYGFNLGGTDEEQSEAADILYHRLTGNPEEGGVGLPVSVSSIAGFKENSIGIFGGLFFIGVFLGILFLMATVLIMYYKQLSEGYDDASRFDVMKKVGMGGREIRRSIHSQVLTVFFLPLVGAGIHVAFAFPFLVRVLSLFAMYNVGLFGACTAGTIVVFGLFYLITYHLTARVYYRIVR